jgi:H+/gluconate symporter-like permease
MFKEYMGLTVGQTFRTWTIMEGIVGVTGLIGVLLLSLVV